MAQNADLLRDGDAALDQRAHAADGKAVVVGADAVKVQALFDPFLGAAVSVLFLKAVDDDHVRLGVFDAVLDQRAGKALFPPLEQVGRQGPARGEEDPAASALQQVVGRHVAAVHVVGLDDHGPVVQVLQIAGRAADVDLGQGADLRAVVDARAEQEDQAADLVLAQELDVGLLPRGVAPRAADEGGVSQVEEALLQVHDDLRKVLVRKVRVENAHRRDALCAHGLGGDVRAVVIALDHLAHARLRFLGKPSIFVDHARDRRNGYARDLRDLPQRNRLFAFHAAHTSSFPTLF